MQTGKNALANPSDSAQSLAATRRGQTGNQPIASMHLNARDSQRFVHAGMSVAASLSAELVESNSISAQWLPTK